MIVSNHIRSNITLRSRSCRSIPDFTLFCYSLALNSPFVISQVSSSHSFYTAQVCFRNKNQACQRQCILNIEIRTFTILCYSITNDYTIFLNCSNATCCFRNSNTCFNSIIQDISFSVDRQLRRIKAFCNFRSRESSR